MASKRKQEAAQKPFWQNKVLLICVGIVLVFGALYYTQRGTSGPQPYEYDPRTNRHWDPQHRHWHNGPPPLTTPAATPGNQSPVNPTATLPASQTTANTPKPYEYNPTTNQYWDPGHNHWHNGKPPPPESQQVVNAVPPVPADTVTHQPYEYDSVGNQYWDPNHQHWHNGKPPTQTLIPPINPSGN
ncbi:MAG: hypothetical protein L0Z48_01560 [candidate division Zixibacteria bacterium]|nr:hypothetical protein [candidate division Zixibacteria bacterium]MCI0595210.1 hypothetical protein [candidate division Zixibacteria bacterium]